MLHECVCVCVSVEWGRMTAILLAKVSGWQKTCIERDIKWPWDGEMVLCLGVLLLLCTVHIWKQAGSLNCFSESQQGGLEGEGEKGVGLPPHLFDSWL